LRDLGWRGDVFVVDDNFIGNRKNALLLVKAIAAWGDAHGRPFAYYTQASVDLAERTELMEAMVEANFIFVFLGIESPSTEALNGSRKFQNLRKDALEQVRIIQGHGLWVTAGFIVGFDSDDEAIFERQRDFIERAAIPWAMAGLLQAPPTTPLFDRMKAEGRLIGDSDAISNFNGPNFRTKMPLPALLNGLSRLLGDLYEPGVYFSRALRSLEAWKIKPTQAVPDTMQSRDLRLLARSIWTQGLMSGYRLAYWGFLWAIIRRYRKNPVKFAMGMGLLIAAHHFLIYSRQVADELKIAGKSACGPLMPTPISETAPC